LRPNFCFWDSSPGCTGGGVRELLRNGLAAAASFKEICERDLEGIVAKRKLSIYKPGGNGWLKIKNKAYTQAEGRQELLTKRK